MRLRRTALQRNQPQRDRSVRIRLPENTPARKMLYFIFIYFLLYTDCSVCLLLSDAAVVILFNKVPMR
uniref:Uncharacterized protein n=1 Tax=Anguilla anguilla TaxID=7936 RepID=A0A0E9W5T0_ANGAN